MAEESKARIKMDPSESRSRGRATGATIGSLVLLAGGVLIAVGEMGYYRTYGCFFSGAFNICDNPTAALLLFITGEVLLLLGALFFGRVAFRSIHRE